MTTYTPINCGFHDYLEHYASKKQYVRIQYFDDVHAVRTVDAIVKDLITQKGEEFMLLNTGEQFRLDQLIVIDGHQNPAHGFDQLSCECD